MELLGSTYCVQLNSRPSSPTEQKSSEGLCTCFHGASSAAESKALTCGSWPSRVRVALSAWSEPRPGKVAALRARSTTALTPEGDDATWRPVAVSRRRSARSTDESSASTARDTASARSARAARASASEARASPSAPSRPVPLMTLVKGRFASAIRSCAISASCGKKKSASNAHASARVYTHLGRNHSLQGAEGSSVRSGVLNTCCALACKRSLSIVSPSFLHISRSGQTRGFTPHSCKCTAGSKVL